MIESIQIADTASFSDTPQLLAGLSAFNFCYGANGTGKTTISRIIAEEQRFPTCAVTWRAGTKLQTSVYNTDFVTRNFDQSSELKGIFTLGEENISALKTIADLRAQVADLETTLRAHKRTLHGEDGTGGKKRELADLEDHLRDVCWKQKQKHDEKLSGAFEHYRGSTEKFKTKVLAERSNNSATVESLANLQKRAAEVFGSTPALAQTITPLDTARLTSIEANPILAKRVVGTADVDIAAMIHKLGNSDWVRAGLAYYKVNNELCPFCQQSTPNALADQLSAYFDETFDLDCKAIEDLSIDYEAAQNTVSQRLASLLVTPSPFLELEKLKILKDRVASIITINRQQIATKKKEPSQRVELKSLADTVSELNMLIGEANLQIANHNETVANLQQARADLKAQVWKYVVEVDLKEALASYDSRSKGLNAAIESLSNKIDTLTKDKADKEDQIRKIEKNTTSIQPTIDAINAILKQFGFLGFSLAKTSNDRYYRLIRPNGTDAKDTLSEGEKNFVTFLYFYHLLKGSNVQGGITADRVVVFDDPVSSFDSDVAFLVSSLIRGLFEEVRSKTGHIKQIFVFTHNVHFHKEITFNPPGRKHWEESERTFWIVRRVGVKSLVDKHKDNPIKTSYELLWEEVRNPGRSPHTIQNILRRILEYYFKILGGIDPDTICDRFSGREKVICKSLFSWVNCGSHFVDDDLYVSIDDSTVETYLRVFKAIFERTEHLPHYEMMMKPEPGANTAPLVNDQAPSPRLATSKSSAQDTQNA